MRRCRRIAARFITLACSTQISISFRFPPMSAVRRSFGRKLRSADDVDSFSLGLLAILTSFRRSLFLLLYDQRATINAIVQLFLPKCLRIIDNITFFPDGHVFCRFIFFLLNRSWGKVDRLESSQWCSLLFLVSVPPGTSYPPFSFFTEHHWTCVTASFSSSKAEGQLLSHGLSSPPVRRYISRHITHPISGKCDFPPLTI